MPPHLLPAASSLVLCLALAGQSPSAGHDAERMVRVGTVAEREVTSGHYAATSFLVLHHGEEVAAGAFGHADVASSTPMRRDTIVRIFSMSKAITAITALTLLEDGLVRLDTKVADWLPEFAAPKVFAGGTADAPRLEPAQKAITVRMLLNHTAGFTYDFFRDSPLHDMYRAADLWSAASLDEFVRRAAALPLLAQPGEQWNYSIADDVLGALIERVAGRPFADCVRDRVTGPLGMADTDFDVPEAKRARLATVHTKKDGAFEAVSEAFGTYAEPGRGFPAGGAGMFSTLDDYAKFAAMLAGGGSWKGVRILGRKTMELATANSLRGTQSMRSPGDGWNLICGVRTDPGAASDLGSQGMLFWSGAATTAFFADPHEDLVGVVFCQHLPHDPERFLSRFRDAVYSALR